MNKKITRELLRDAISDILVKRGLEIREEQMEFLSNPETYESIKPLVLAADTSSGKTEMAIIYLEIIYQILGESEISLVIPASKTVLLHNMANRIMDFSPSFTYLIISSDPLDEFKKNYLYISNLSSQEIQKKMEDLNPQVLVSLPITYYNNFKFIKKIGNFVLDEAYEWYFTEDGKIPEIIETLNPKRQLLLSAPISKFNAERKKFNFYYIPGFELYKKGRTSNVQIEILSSSIDYKNTDYVSFWGDLSNNVGFDAEGFVDEFKGFIYEIYKKIKNPVGSKIGHNIANLTNNWASDSKIFGRFFSLEKTIMTCFRIEQANIVHKILNSIEGLEGRVLLSHGENDSDSLEFSKFRENPQYLILIVVGRGRAGLNLEELFNVVDMTCSRNLDVLKNMFGRILRKSKKNPGSKKYYFKVAPKGQSLLFQYIMQGVLCLMDRKWYSIYDGKNMGALPVFRITKKRNKKDQENETHVNIRGRNKNIIDIEDEIQNFPFPLDCDFYTHCYHNDSQKIATTAYTTVETTLERIRKEMLNEEWSYEKTLEIYEEVLSNLNSLDIKSKGINEIMERENVPKFFIERMFSLHGMENPKDLNKAWKIDSLYLKKLLEEPGASGTSVGKILNVSPATVIKAFFIAKNKGIEINFTPRKVTDLQNLPESTLEEIRVLAKSGKSKSDIAKSISISRRSIIKIIKDYSIEYDERTAQGRIDKNILKKLLEKEGYSYQNSAKYFGVQANDIKESIEKFKSEGFIINYSPYQTNKKKIELKDVIKLHEKNLSIAEISKNLGVSDVTIKKFMEENNIEPNKYKKGKSLMVEVNMEELKKLIKEGISKAEISKIMGYSPQTISRRSKLIK